MPDTITRANGFTLNVPLASIPGGETVMIVLMSLDWICNTLNAQSRLFFIN